MIRTIKRTTQFKKDYKKAIKSGYREDKNVRECHIYPDWLLVYRVYKTELILELIRTGSHSELF